MSGQLRLAICAAVATLASSCALLPLVTPADWLLRAALLLAVQSTVGVLTRLARLARPLTIAAQALVSLELLTLIFAREQALAGLLPGQEAFREFGVLLTTGTQDVAQYAIPAPVTDGIQLLLIGGVLVIGLLVDTLAVTYRAAALSGLPLLALYSVAAGLSEDGASWQWFLCAAAGYLLLLLAEGRERLSQWGRVFSGAGSGGRAPGAGPGGRRAVAPLRTGCRIGALALSIALAVPALLPSLGGGLLPPSGRVGRGAGAGAVSAVNPLVALQDSLNQPENRTALTYITDAPGTQDLYLRIVALDQFDGAAWRPSERPLENLAEVRQPLPYPPGLSGDVRTTTVTTRISAADWYAQNWLPMPYPASRVRVAGRWQFDPEGRTVAGDGGQTTQGVQYEVQSLAVRPTAQQLARARRPSPGIFSEYTQVPGSLPEVVHATARRVTDGAGNGYERAVRLQDWFARDGGFTYDTEVRAGSGSAAIVNFLEQKEGFCVHFAFSMAAMARTLGIPARVAVGFTPGIPDGGDGRMAVGLQDAHAWPELYFEGVGWTRFEPTPTRGTTPAYAQPDSPDSRTGGNELPRTRTSQEPEAESSQSPECTSQARRPDGCEDAQAIPTGGDPTDRGLPWGTAMVAGAAGLAVSGLLLFPLLWRTRVRWTRLSGGAVRADHRVRTLAAWRELTDSGWDYGVVPDESATPRKAAARLARLGGLDDDAAQAAHRVAGAVEQVLYAPSVPEARLSAAAGLAADVRRVRAGLGAAAEWRLRLRAVVLPRSSVRVVRALAQRGSPTGE